MPDHWGTARVEDVCLLVTSGGTPSRTRADFYCGSEGIPWVRTQEIVDRVINETAEHITQEAVSSSSAKILPPGTLLMAMYAAPTAGRLAILGREMACNQAACAMVFDDAQVFNKWAYYQFLLNRRQLHQLANGAAQQNLSARLIRDLELPLPPVTEQQAIAGVLGALDDKIESNRRVVDVLDELGRQELGMALQGEDGTPWEYAWPERTLGSVLDVIESGGRPQGGVAGIESGVPSIGAESIVRAGIFNYGKTKYVPKEYFEAMKRGVLESGDVLLYKDGGTPGNFIPHVSMTQAGFPFVKAAINEHVYRLRIKAPYSQAFLYYWLSSRRLLDEMWLRGTGAAIPGLNSSNVKELPVVEPPTDKLERVLPLVDTIVGDLHQRAKETRVLENMRDALLPELLSGRLRVRDADSVMGEFA